MAPMMSANIPAKGISPFHFMKPSYIFMVADGKMSRHVPLMRASHPKMVMMRVQSALHVLCNITTVSPNTKAMRPPR